MYAEERMTGGKGLGQSGHSLESCSCCSLTYLRIIWTFETAEKESSLAESRHLFATLS